MSDTGFNGTYTAIMITPPSPFVFCQLEIPEAALVVLKLLVSDQAHASRSFGRPGWTNGLQPLIERTFDMSTVFSSHNSYHGDNRDVQRILSQAWKYAHNKGYLYTTSDPIFSRVTEEGIAFAELEIRFQNADQLCNLHPNIRAKVEPQFRVAKNSDAIALAFNEVESVAKTKAWPGHTPPHRQWIEQAFDHTKNGALVNLHYSVTEQKSIKSLFLGAFGRYRNLHAHQNPHLDEAETINVLCLTSLLMNELDALP